MGHHCRGIMARFVRSRKEGATYESRYQLSSSQSRNNGKLRLNSSAFPTHLVGKRILSCLAVLPPDFSLLLQYSVRDIFLFVLPFRLPK